MDGYKVVVTKSTVPVGPPRTRVKQAIIEEQKKSTKANDSAWSRIGIPEGGRWRSRYFMRPDRIIVGSDDPRAIALLRQLYAPFQRNRERDHRHGRALGGAHQVRRQLDARGAISFMNELANLAEVIGADIEEVRRGIGSDPRIGYQFLYAGAGYGGSCFPKDVKALQRSAQEAGMPLRLMHAVEDVNDAQKRVLGEKIRSISAT
jgi:UDPglucose 6-dehydrogenase